MDHLCGQYDFKIAKGTKINQHICRDIRDWLRGSTKPMSTGLSLDDNDFIIFNQVTVDLI